MKLYFSPGACSLSPHIVAQEAGLKLDFEKVDLASHKTAAGRDYTQVNPKGYVPALQLDDGAILTEGPAIVQYLADQQPSNELIPEAGSLERYRVQEWLNFISAELHKNFGPLFDKSSADAVKQTAKANLTKRLGYLNDQLANKQYLMGAKFTVADAYAFTILNWTRFVGIDLKSSHPNLAAYLDRVAARPKVQEAMRAEGLIK